MTTATKRKARRTTTKEIKAHLPKSSIADHGDSQQMDIGQVDICPRNYRKVFTKKDIEDFSKELKMHGIISSLTVRPMPNGRYELVAGERRYRAAKLAKISILPVQVRTLTDEEAHEIRLAENIHRENPHPLYEAYAVKEMLDSHGSIDEVARRMGRSKAFVYSRIKVSELIESFQEVFLNDKIGIAEAELIAGLAPETQLALYEEEFHDWEDDDFSVQDLAWNVSRYRCDLLKAPFDLDDPQLLAEAGACSSCPFNSSTLSYLFPEMAKEATCSNRACYSSKCHNQRSREILEAIEANKPEAILYRTYLSEETTQILDELQETAELPRFDRWNVTLIDAPEQPYRGHYEDCDEEGEPMFDEAGYSQALQEYEDDLHEYKTRCQADGVLRGMEVSGTKFSIQLFAPKGIFSDDAPNRTTVTAKEVQEAIKSGTATIELLQKEIDRLNERETRSKEIDADKIQKQVHEKFKEQILNFPELRTEVSTADQVAIRLIVFSTLDWQMKGLVAEQLLPDLSFHDPKHRHLVYDALKNLNEHQFSFLVKAALCGNSLSQYPGNIFGYALYQCAEMAGIATGAICKEQDALARSRQEKKDAKVKDVEVKITKLMVVKD